MSVLGILLAVAIAIGTVFGLLLLEQIRHDRRHRNRFCMTCGQYHPDKAPHI